MGAFFSDIRRTILPNRDSKDGPLPPLMVAMTKVGRADRAQSSSALASSSCSW
jgi:hypothetical protein